MDVMDVIDFIAPQLLTVFCTYYFVKLVFCFLAVKENIIAKVVTIIGLFFVIAIIIYPEDMVNILVLLLLFLLLMIACFKGTLLQKISAVFILYPLVIAINFITEDISYQAYLIWGDIPYFGSVVHFLTYLVRIPIYYFVYRQFMDKIKNAKDLLTGYMWLLIDIICLASLVSMITFVSFTPAVTWCVYPALLSCITTSLGCIYLTGYIADKVKTDMENKNLHIQEIYYNELAENQKYIGKLHHDMNNHLSVIGTFLEHDYKIEAREYFQNLSGQFSVHNRVFCKNSIVNAVLNSKYNLAVGNKIDCFFNIDLNNLLSIDNISLCSVFANTLDNAIEASSKINEPSERKISVKGRYENSYFSYEITNTKENEIIEKKGLLLSDKADKKAHGIGLSNVRDIVNKYNGTLDISYTSDSFSVVILIGNV